MKDYHLDEPTAENLYILTCLLSGLRSELRTLIKYGLSADPETENTRMKIAEHETAIESMKTKLNEVSG